jgi:putative flippase GtrA
MSSFKQGLRRVVEVQWIKFLLASVPGTAISFPLYWLMTSQTGLGVVVASVTSNIVAQAINFFPQKLWTFQEPRLDSKTIGFQALKYFSVASFFFLIEPTMLYSFTSGWEWHPIPAWLVVHLVTAPARFQLEKIIFKPR